MNYLPQQDGKTHINVYSRSKSKLGRLLSNFAHTPFYHPEHGLFASVEGFWYWLMTGDEVLRELHGVKAKFYGRDLFRTRLEPTREELKVAYLSKLNYNRELKKLLLENELPLAYYYVYGPKVHVPEAYQWTITLWEEIRKELVNNAL
jgi:hypothetical protein